MYNSTMAEIHARRRLRLRQLIEERFENNQVRLGKAVGLDRSGIRTALNGSSNLGEYAARRIEEALGLPHGWMDSKPPPGAVPKTPYKTRTGPPPKVHTHAVDNLLAEGHTQAEIARRLGGHESHRLAGGKQRA